MSTLRFTKKAAADLAAAYAAPDLVAQREAVLQLLKLRPGERVIDIGCGPGFLSESMAAQTGPGGHVLGVDISDDLIALCRDRAPPANLSYAVEDALSLSAGTGSFDVAVSTQVAEYVPDTTALLAEMARVLRPGGRALVMATDWRAVGWHSTAPARMTEVMRAWEKHCAHPCLPRVLAPALRQAGFIEVQATMHPLVNLSFHRKSYSYAIAKLLRDYVQKENVTPETIEAWFDDLVRLDEAGQYYFTSARMILQARKAG